MNKVLQKWAEKKVATLKRWSKEYDELCKAEGIEENPLISFALDRDYISSLYAIADDDETKTPELLFKTESLFLINEEGR